MNKLIFLLCLLLCCATLVRSQDTKPFVVEGDAKYYDFWVGDWKKILKDNKDTHTEFKVSKSVHPAAYYEEWTMQTDSVTTLHAVALRAWDKINNKWMYTWVSDNGLYQVWDSMKLDGNWYIYK